MNIFSLIDQIAGQPIDFKVKQAFCLHVDQVDYIQEHNAIEYAHSTHLEDEYTFGRYYAVLKEIVDNGVTLHYYHLCEMYGIKPWNIAYRYELEAEEDSSILERGAQLMTVQSYVNKRLTEKFAEEMIDDLPF